MTNVVSYIADLNAQFDERVRYETVEKRNDEFSNMQKELRDQRKSMTHESIAAIMLACNVNVAFINRQERSNNRYNVKSIDKVDNIARFLAMSVATLNHYTLNILKSCIALSDADMSMSHADAQHSCSLDVKLSDAKKKKFMSQYQSHIAASTASTQSSSSINALEMFHLIKQTRDASNTICYTFNNEHVLANDIRDKLNMQKSA